ncbi:MAG: alpha/beta hydrolase [Burkholderiales bacterium]|nr:alpha/beta hydrolase [Burkholderiales bacterium]
MTRAGTAGSRLPDAPEPTRIWAGSGGVRIAGDVWGDPHGRLVILMHGGGQTRHAWGGTGHVLGGAGYHAVALDARGHGDSQWAPDADYSLDAMVRDLVCVIDAPTSPPPVLVGASMGGITALVAIGEGRVEASALVLVDVAPRIEPDGSARIQAFMRQRPEGFASLEEVAEAIDAYRPRQGRPRNLEGLSKNVRIGADGRYRWHWDPRYLGAPREHDRRYERLAACAQRLSLPTLLVRGGSSDVVSEDGVRDFRELCPHSEYVNVAEAGHMVAGDRNDAFGRAAVAFLRRAVPA